MTPHRSSLPDDKRQLSRPRADTTMSWGTRQAESETESRSRSTSAARSGASDEPVHCPSCGSEKTTVVQSANRGPRTSIRPDNPGHKCFGCGTGWTMTIGDDRDPQDQGHS